MYMEGFHFLQSQAWNTEEFEYMRYLTGQFSAVKQGLLFFEQELLKEQQLLTKNWEGPSRQHQVASDVKRSQH